MLKIMALFISFNVFAETETNKEKKEDIYKNKGNIDVGVQRSSHIHRKDKTFSIHVGAGYEAVTASYSLGLGYFIDKDLIIEFRGAYGEDENEIGGMSSIERVGTAALGLKFFTSNTFYIRPAFEYMSIVDDEDDAASLMQSDSRKKIKGMGFSFSIGNQWQYNNFTIGCDWLGVKRIVNASTSENDPDRAYLSFLGFYVGTTF